MRWRLRLAKFDFKPVYKKGSSNSVADTLSRSEYIPCFMVEETERPFLEDDIWDHPCYTVLSTESDDQFEPIHLDELIREQARDAYCCSKRTNLQYNWLSPFKEDELGLLISISNLDGVYQIVIPKSLRHRLLSICHNPKNAGHPVGRKMFYSMRRHYYWPSMSLDVYNTVKRCEPCAKESIRLRKHTEKLKLFPATFPLEGVALDYLGPLPTTKNGYTHLLVIADRYSKLTR